MATLAEHAVRGAGSYAEARSRHTWRVSATYNIAADACDQHASDPGRLALIWEGEDGRQVRYTFRELKALSDRVASGLAALGVTRGERVGFMLPQTPEHAAAQLGVLKLGAVSVPLSRLFGGDALRHRLGDSGTRVLLTDRQHVGRVLEIRDDLPELRHVVLCDRPRPSRVEPALLTFDDLLDRATGGAGAVETRAEDPAFLIYTSGTTAAPRGALHAHRCLLGYNGVDYANDFFRPGDVYWSPADWAWVGGLLVGLFCPLAHNVSVVASTQPFSGVGALELMARHGVTTAGLPPTALRKLALEGGDPRRFDLRLRCVFGGGERMTPDIYRWAAERFGVSVNEVYGQTEANIVVGENTPLIPPRPDAMGRPYPGHDVAIVDDDGVPLPAGEVGNIAIRRGDPALMLGYWGDPEGTAARYRNDWFLTGDLAHSDEAGWLHYQGRADDIINSAGFRIGPAEVESCLMEHPAVAQSAVIGVPDPVRGEAVKAFVVLRAGCAPSPALADELIRHVKDRLGAFQRPREIAWVDELPMTVSGKIRRAELRRREAAGKA